MIKSMSMFSWHTPRLGWKLLNEPRKNNRGMVHGANHQLVECVFDVGTLVMEDMNKGIDLANVGIESLDVLLFLYVVDNQGIEYLGARGGHLGRGKIGRRVYNEFFYR